MAKIEITLIVLECLRCEHTWTPRKQDVRTCPSCKSPYWDTPKEVKTNPDKLEKEKP